MDNNTVTPFCKSVFKNGANTTSKSTYTKKWIETINYIEKIKKR